MEVLDMTGFWSRLFVVFAVSVFVLPLFAADKNFIDYDENTYYHACERLMDANLSGYFVVTDVGANRSQFVSLNRLGASSAYVLATAKMDMRAQGIRELTFGRMPDGWLIADPYSPQKRVNVMSIERHESTVRFKFADVADVNQFEYHAVPHEDVGTIVGDILSPDGWILNMEAPYSAQYRFTRVKLDRTFEQVVSQSLKSLLADRSEAGRLGNGDHIITVEMKMPLTLDEASRLLGTEVVYPIQDRPGANTPSYRFAVANNLFSFLESIGRWTRLWQIAHIDAVPGSMLNKDLVDRIVSVVQASERSTETEAQVTVPKAKLQALENAITGTGEESSEPTTSAAIEALRNIGGNIGGGDIRAYDPKSLQARDQQHPRDLDEDRDGERDDHVGEK
jgi:hypothetical protein